jgi:hypothetical protein
MQAPRCADSSGQPAGSGNLSRRASITVGLRELGVDVDGAVSARRPTTKACLDWTERRPHLAGALGSAVGTRFLEAGWVTRHRSGRGLNVTEAGRAVVRETWGIDVADAEPTRPAS